MTNRDTNSRTTYSINYSEYYFTNYGGVLSESYSLVLDSSMV